MIPTTNRNDVMAQWYSNEFIREHRDVFEKVVINPGEALLVIKDGKPGDVLTETDKKSIIPRFLEKIKESISGKKDIQVYMADLKEHTIRLPISGFTKDRFEIKCVVNLGVRVSKTNMIKIVNLMSMNLVSDAKWNGLAKEVCEEDISKNLEYDTKVIVDSFVFPKYNSSDVRDNMHLISNAIADAINSLMVNWADKGLDVVVNSVDVTENGYEDVMKLKALQSKSQMIEEIKFLDDQKTLADSTELVKLSIRMDNEIEFEKLKSKYQKEEFITSSEWKIKLENMENTAQISEIDRQIKLDSARVDVQIRQLENELDNDKKWMDARLNTFIMDEELRRDIERNNNSTDNQIRIAQAKLDNELTMKLAQRDSEYMRLLAQAESSIDKARREGYDDGYKKGREDAYKDGTNFGKVEGLERALNSMQSIAETQAKSGKSPSSESGNPQQPQQFYQPQYAPQMYAQPQFAPQYAPQMYAQPQYQQQGRTCPRCGMANVIGAFCNNCGNKME